MKQALSKVGIGASEISTVCGINPFSSPWDLYLVRIGEKAEFAGNALTDWGHRLEPAIRQKYVDDTGFTVDVPRESIFSSATPWARATPDGIVIHPTHHLLQCKNVGFWVGKDWEHAPPTYVQLQEQWEMYVTGLDRADIAALIGGSEFRVFTVHRDDKVIGDLLTIATDFMRRIEQRIPPEIDNSDACKAHFEKRLANANAIEMVADQELDSLFASWKSNCHMLKICEKEIGRIRNVVRSRLAEAQADRVVSTFGIAKLDKNKQLMAPKNWSKETA